MKPIRDIIKEVVQLMDKKHQPKLFLADTPELIREKLISYGNAAGTRDAKYPLIALSLEVEESASNTEGLTYEVSLLITIACSASKDWSTDERYARSFNAVLNPMYLNFIEALGYHELINPKFVYPHKKIDLLYYGRNMDKQTTDYVDAIQLRNLQLEILNI